MKSSVFPVCFVLLFTLLIAGCGGDSDMKIKDRHKAERQLSNSTTNQTYSGRAVDEVGVPVIDASIAEAAIDLGATGVTAPDGALVEQMSKLSTAGVSMGGKCSGYKGSGKAKWGIRSGSATVLTPENLTTSAAQLKTRRAQLTPMINQIAAKYGMDHLLIHAIVSQESRYNPQARSPVGAMGLMQLMPGTARELGVRNAFNPTQNVDGGTRYIRGLVKQMKGNIGLAIASYNSGAGNIMWCGYRVPPFKETQDYVRKVSGYYNAYAKGGL